MRRPDRLNGLRNAGFEPGDRVAVIGLGGLGHLGVLYAKAMGARVAVLSGSPDKEDEAKELGAERFISEEGAALSEALLDWESGANIILATAPSTAPMTDALPGLAPDGTLAVLGAAAEEISVTPMNLIGARRDLIGSPSGSRKDIRDALQFCRYPRRTPPNYQASPRRRRRCPQRDARAPPSRARRSDHGVGEARLNGKRRSPDHVRSGLL